MLQLLLMSMLSRLNHVATAKLVPQPWKEYQGMSLDQRIAVHIEWAYNDYQAVQSKYDPRQHRPNSDDELRNRLATIGLGGAHTLDEFRDAVLASIKSREDLVRTTFEQWMSQIPTQLLVIADSMSVFEDPDLFTRMVADTQRISALRGSEILPD